MSRTGPAWHSDDHPAPVPITWLGYLRAASRGLPLAVVVFGGLASLLMVRVVEAPLFAPRRPMSPWVTCAVCRAAFVLLGIRRQTQGLPIAEAGAAVANHASWLDIFALNAAQPVYFVAKAEVASWPGIGWLARATGTLFIERERRRAAAQRDQLRDRLGHGHHLVFFPEGTSTDGQRVLPFKPTLFAAFEDPAFAALKIQPVTIRYHAPPGTDRRFYCWWGDMGFGPHLLAVLAAPRQGSVTVQYHPPTVIGDHAGRKAMAVAAEAEVRHGFSASEPPPSG